MEATAWTALQICVLLTLAAGGASCSGGEAAPADGNAVTSAAVKGFAAAAEKIGADAWSRSTDAATLAWGQSYVLMAYLAMWEGTGETAYLDRFLTHCDRVLAARDDRHDVTDEIRGKVMPSWSTTKYTRGKRYAWIVHAGMITYPMARWAWLIRRDPAMRKRYADKAREYVKAVAETVAAFDDAWREGPNDGEGHYLGRYLKRALPLNQQNAMGRTLVALHLATGRDEYRSRAAKLARYFKNRIRRVDDRYVWSYWPPRSGAEDFSHAAINVDFAVACCRAGIVFDAGDMAAFARTFRRASKGASGFTTAVDGRGGPDARHSAQAGRWLHLAFYDPDLRGVACKYYEGRWAISGTAGLVAAAYLVETARPLRPERPVSDPGGSDVTPQTRPAGR